MVGISIEISFFLEAYIGIGTTKVLFAVQMHRGTAEQRNKGNAIISRLMKWFHHAKPVQN